MIVAIEGGDQAGKRTQSALLRGALRRRGLRAAVLEFPDYSTPAGRAAAAHLSGRRRAPPQAVHCLLAANRWERLGRIERAASENDVVVMNRYYHSNVAYGAANGLRAAWLEGLDAGLPRSDLVVLLDLPPAESFRRKRSGRDAFERKMEFVRRVRKEYLRMARGRRWRTVDAARPAGDVHADVLRIVEGRLRA